MNRFTAEQVREYNDAFVMFDKDGSGDIHCSELRDMLKTIGFNPTDETLENMSIIIDEDGNGMINFEEFMELIGENMCASFIVLFVSSLTKMGLE